ncbi:hypothetical protein GCM10027081_49150 [Cupriavidus yeoncheonensis]
MNRLSAYPYRLAALALLSACVAPTVCHADGGTIYFSGMIVAPPYEMRVVPGAARHGPGSRVARADIGFLSQPANRPSASVRVDGLGSVPLALQYTDARGRRSSVPSTGSYHLGRDGGTLSIASSSGGPVGATVTVAYD